MEEDRIISYKTEFMTKLYGKIYQHKNNVSITPTDVYNLYPVGSIYLSVNNTNPSNFFGGTWEKMSGGYLYGAANSIDKTDYTGWHTQAATGNTGSTILTIDQIPEHKHGVVQWNGRDSGSLGRWCATMEWKNSVAGENNNNNYWTGMTDTRGSGKGHTHTLNSHAHHIATIDVFIWKRVA